MIIAISGKIKSGKNATANLINELCNNKFEEKAFAKKLKQIVSLLTGYSVEDLEKQEIKDFTLGQEWNKYHDIVNEVGNSTTEVEKYTIRKLLQKVGTEAMRNVIHENIWVSSLFVDYKPQCKSYCARMKTVDDAGCTCEQDCDCLPNWLITDMRFLNEANAVKERLGYLVRIERPSVISISNHPSETGLDNYEEWDYFITNDGTLEDLKEKVKEMLKHFNIPINESN